ncbi:MAG: SDR family oxidoreductase [Actinomycetota bacterium]|nr:SDR family oxidoreductase [Actinomycetota bacterium]
MGGNGELFGITGATGEVGGRVASRLAALGCTQRLIVRNAAAAPKLAGAEVATITDYGDFESVNAAAEGLDTLFLVSGREHEDRLKQHKTAIDAVESAGVGRIVYLSFLGAAPDATFTLARQHYATEEHIRTKGIPFTFLRSSLYLDVIPWVCSPGGMIAGPAGKGRLAPVARDDVADTVVAVLTSREHDGASYDNTGPKTLSLQDVAEELSRVTGKTVRYKNETVEEAWASRRPTGAPEWEIEGWITSYLAIARGELDVVSDTVARLTGHPPMSLPEFLEAHPDSCNHI